ncbi:MAG: leucyl aminopeptidase [Paracoccaceae bacterium]|nr:leucyl aminopeptidase [Paracoccaceae bacterium]
MTDPRAVRFAEIDLDAIAEATGRVVVFVADSGKLDQLARRVNRLTRGALERLAESEAFDKLGEGEALEMAFPTGLHAEALDVVKLNRRPTVAEARKAGGAFGAKAGSDEVLVLAGNIRLVEEIALGAVLKAYDFRDHKTGEGATGTEAPPPFTVMVSKREDAEAAAVDVAALAAGVFFTRDLVTEPANVLTTTEFARRLEALTDLGVAVEVLEEPELEKLGMRTLLSVGNGSDSPSKVVVMRWEGGGREAPLALLGKGVVFDTGGISLKPAQGMEDMTMDMGGAGTVAGVMKAIALRKARANVVGIVGLVENMPDGRATRPGDVVRSMKGDTVEIINTDAEGRLVLADVLWYAQDRFQPAAMIDLATLTGAIIVSLGHEKAGVFSNDDGFARAFLDAAKTEGEGAWHMPLGPAYDRLLKSEVADMKNVGGRWGGAITAAQFLQRFVKGETPWIHLDIAGVASTPKPGDIAPKGPSGWGVLSLDRLIRNRHER